MYRNVVGATIDLRVLAPSLPLSKWPGRSFGQVGSVRFVYARNVYILITPRISPEFATVVRHSRRFRILFRNYVADGS